MNTEILSFVVPCPECNKRNRVVVEKLILNLPICGFCNRSLSSEYSENEIGIIFCLQRSFEHKDYIHHLLDDEDTDVLTFLNHVSPSNFQNILESHLSSVQIQFEQYISKQTKRQLDKLQSHSRRTLRDLAQPHGTLMEMDNEGILEQMFAGAVSREGAVGASVGAMVGSIVPGIGNVLGAAIGGYIGGSMVGKKREQEFSRAFEKLAREIDHYYDEMLDFYREYLEDDTMDIFNFTTE